MKKILFILLLHSNISLSQICYFPEIINKGTTLFQDSTLISFIKEWIGVPYKYGGKTKRGIDCSQFTKRLYKDVYNKDLPNVCWKQWDVTTRIEKDCLEKGDLVFFKSRRSPSGWHVGVYLGEGKFIHSPGRRDHVKISNLNIDLRLKEYIGAGRLL